MNEMKMAWLISDTKKKLELCSMADNIVFGLEYLEKGDKKNAKELIGEGIKLFSYLLEPKEDSLFRDRLISYELGEMIKTQMEVNKAKIKEYKEVLDNILKDIEVDKNKITEIQSFATDLTEIFIYETGKHLDSIERIKLKTKL